MENQDKSRGGYTEYVGGPSMSPINPSHYRQEGKMEAIEIMKNSLSREEFKGFLKGLILKYLYRADEKNGIEDYQKAQWYINYLVKWMEE